MLQPGDHIRAGDGVWWSQAAATPLVDALLDRFAAAIETERALPPAPDRAPDDVDEAIAANVAGLVEDGDTIQVGVGCLPAAILDGLSGHQDRGLHTGMITDGVLRLMDEGVITGRRKEIDPGVVVTGAAIGSAELYTRLNGIEFRAASCTHSAAAGSVARPPSPVPRPAPARVRSSRCARRWVTRRRSSRRWTAAPSPPPVPTSTRSSPSTASRTCEAARCPTDLPASR